MKIMMIGDVVSQIGCDYLRSKLPNFKRENKIDIVIANGENSAIGNGILPASANFLLDSGVDVITTGNHVFKRHEIQDYLEEAENVLRPVNFPHNVSGRGYYIYQSGSLSLCVINMMGTSYLEPLDCPFQTIDKILKTVDTKCILIDFHAEATGEKKALAYYVDGRVSAVVGTHTHVQTADAQILPNGTGFITDVGMTGPINSVLGVCPENVINRLKTHMPTRFEVAQGECKMDCVVIELCNKSGKCESISSLRI